MPYYTPNKGYPVPRDGEDAPSDDIDGPIQGAISNVENWGDVMQTLASMLDEDVPGFGPIEDIPNTNSGVNLYFATNATEKQWYFNTGTEWVEEAEYEPEEGTGGGGTGGTGDIPAEAAAVSNLSITNWRIIDVGNHGYPGDRTGGDLTQLFEQYPDTLFVLPNGEYEMTEYVNSNYDRFGVIGMGSVTVHPLDTSLLHFFDLGDRGSSDHGGDTILKNVEFSIADEIASNQAYDCGLIKGHAHDHWQIENVSFTGTRHRKGDAAGTVTYGSRYQTKLDAAKEGVIEVNRLYMPDGGTFVGTTGADMVGHSIGMAVEYHEGVLDIKNSYLEGFIDNGFYTTHNLVEAERGIVNIKNSTVIDCGNSNFRPGVNHNIEDCITIQRDLDGTRESQGSSGVALNIQDLDNCNIDGMRVINEGNINDVVRIQDATTGADINGLVIDNDASVNTIELNGTAANEGQPVTFTNCKLNDTGTGSSKSSAIYADRPDVQFDKCQLNVQNRGVVELAGEASGMRFTDCELTSNSSSHWQVRLDTKNDPGPDGTLRFEGCTFKGVADFCYQDPEGNIDQLYTLNNDFTDGSTGTDIRGTVGEWFHMGNTGWIGPNLNPDVENKSWTDTPVDSRIGYPSGAYTYTNDLVYLEEEDSLRFRSPNGWRELTMSDPVTRVIDAFNDGDLSEYGTMTTSGAAVNATAAHSGAFGLQLDGFTSNSGIVRSDSGLPNYPSQYDTFSYWFNTQRASQSHALLFCLQNTGSDTSQAYRLIAAYGSNAVEFQEKGTEGNNYIHGASGPRTLTWQTNTWYRMRVNWNPDNTFTITLDKGPGTTPDVQFTSTEPSYTYTSGGIAWVISGDDNDYIDEAVII